MSAKYYCDRCRKQITKQDKRSVLGRIVRKLGAFTVEVMAAKNNVWNAAELCEDCQVHIVVNGKRVKE